MHPPKPPADHDDEVAVTIRIPKSLFVLTAPPPATVTHKTVEQHFGITPRKFRQMASDGMFPVKKLGREMFAAYEDVRRVVTEGAVARARVQRAVERAASEPVVAGPMSLREAYQYMDSSRDRRELRARKGEVAEMGGELSRRYGKTLPDGTPNTDANEELAALGLRLLLAGQGIRCVLDPDGVPFVNRDGIGARRGPR